MRVDQRSKRLTPARDNSPDKLTASRTNPGERAWSDARPSLLRSVPQLAIGAGALGQKHQAGEYDPPSDERRQNRRYERAKRPDRAVTASPLRKPIREHRRPDDNHHDHGKSERKSCGVKDIQTHFPDSPVKPSTRSSCYCAVVEHCDADGARRAHPQVINIIDLYGRENPRLTRPTRNFVMAPDV